MNEMNHKKLDLLLLQWVPLFWSQYVHLRICVRLFSKNNSLFTYNIIFIYRYYIYIPMYILYKFINRNCSLLKNCPQIFPQFFRT
jgi:hypothetical protein